jgi:hypothetical protein
LKKSTYANKLPLLLLAYRKRSPLGIVPYYSLRGLALGFFDGRPHITGTNFSSEETRCGLEKEESPDGTYYAYFPFGL